MTQGMFRMPSFGVLPDPENWVRLMREGERHMKCGVSEVNFIKLLSHLRLIADGDEKSLLEILPLCIKTYLEDAREDKRRDWCNALRAAATNLAYEKLCGDVPIERHGFQTSYPAEDVVMTLVVRNIDDNPQILLKYLSPEVVSGLSGIDPHDDDGDNDDDADDGDDEEVGEEGRNVTTSEFFEIFFFLMDDNDAEFLWDIDPDSFEYRAAQHDYYFVGAFEAEMMYAEYMATTDRMNMINYHPDCWFIHCKDDGVRAPSAPVGQEG